MAGRLYQNRIQATFTFSSTAATTTASTSYVPKGWRIVKAWYEVTTALVGAGNISLGVTGTNELVKAATAYNDASFTADTPTVGVQDGAPANYGAVVAADTPLNCTNSGTMTSGVIVLHCDIEPKL